MPRDRSVTALILGTAVAAIVAPSGSAGRPIPGIPAQVVIGRTIACPAGVAVSGALPEQPGWNSFPIRWETELANLYVTPRPDGGSLLTCSYIARQKDGTAIRDFFYNQVVSGVACAVTPNRQFSCRALAAQ
jgi:hypothetical protein